MNKVRAKRPRGNILVVDDDLFTRETMEAMLTGEGYEVRCAPNGQTSLLFSEQDPPELILLDVRLPDMDGFQVCQRLKEIHQTREIPVIFLSALEEMADKIKGFEAGGVDYVTKPFQAKEVVARIETHLALYRLRNHLDDLVSARTKQLEAANQRLFASEKVLVERLRFEQLLSELSARFVNIPPDQVDSEIGRGLGEVLEFFAVDRVGMLEVLPGEASWQVTHAAVAEGITPVPLNATLPVSVYPWTYDKVVQKGKVVVFSRLDELPAEANRDRQTYIEWGIRSDLTIPLIIGEQISRVIAINSVKREYVWPEEFIQRVRLLGEIFANSLERAHMQRQLQKDYGEIQELKYRLETENIFLRREITLLSKHEEIVGESEAIRRVLANAEKVALTDSTVLILGETGTGKELIARHIHDLSKRRDRPLVTVNCSALPSALIENEIFGREKGAYTGALTRMVGRFEAADGSTLFLDEIGELPYDVQSKLLRVLEQGTFERLGSTKTIHADVRLIAASNRDLAGEVSRGAFRSDLYYRLNVFPINVIPLRERLEDIPALVWAFVREFEKKLAKRIDSISKKSMEALQHHQWPGNIRELRNVVEHSMIVCDGKILTLALPVSAPEVQVPSSTLEDIERKHILQMLEKTGWRLAGKDGAAEILGMKRTTLQARIRTLGITRLRRHPVD